jgi:hypothetical protein
MAMSFLDRLQQAWQCQPGTTLEMNPDQLLKGARHERRVQLWVDISLISFFSCVAVFMLWSAFRDIQKDWPWLIYSASLAWVVGYILFNRWRRRRHAARYDEPLLAHVEGSITDIEHRMWMDRYSAWWYVLPVALGCMIPPILFFANDHSNRPLYDSLMPLLSTEGTFVATFVFVYVVMKVGVRIANGKHRQELQALQALRETLLDTSA